MFFSIDTSKLVEFYSEGFIKSCWIVHKGDHTMTKNEPSLAPLRRNWKTSVRARYGFKISDSLDMRTAKEFHPTYQIKER